jgi:hypothetical protein
MELGTCEVQRLEADVLLMQQYTGSKAFTGNPVTKEAYAPVLLPAMQQQLEQARQQQQVDALYEVSKVSSAWTGPQLLVAASGQDMPPSCVSSSLAYVYVGVHLVQQQ